MGVAVDAAGNVYASDSGNDCVRVLTPLPPVPQINAGGVVNLASFTAPVAAGSIAAVLGSLFVNTAADTDLPLDESLQDLSFLFGAGTWRRCLWFRARKRMCKCLGSWPDNRRLRLPRSSTARRAQRRR